MAEKNAEIAVLQAQMIDVKTELKDSRREQKEGFDAVFAKLDGLDSKYALKEDVKKLKWQTLPLTVLTTALITALIYYFVNSVSGK
jgi:hypothetical protein